LTGYSEFRVVLNSFPCPRRSVLPKPLELLGKLRTARAPVGEFADE
jgi:hypothetical protein